VLQVRRLCKTYGRVSALTDVDLDVHRGEVLAVLGNNGAGKSSLVEILAGVERPDSGTIAVNGVPSQIDRPDTAHSLGIATVFQDLGLCANMTIVENMYLGRELGGLMLDDATMTEHAAQLLRQLHAGSFRMDAKITDLTGAERQIVAIARSLLGDPSLVVLDEPTAALGVEQRATVLRMIRQLRARGISIVMVSHDLEDVVAVADRVVVLRLGRVSGVFTVRNAMPEQVRSAMSVVPAPHVGSVGLFEPLVPPR
jgi:simple sugar transport system ATP-binding protein/D-xylose transport system ATP-binding protein